MATFGWMMLATKPSTRESAVVAIVIFISVVLLGKDYRPAKAGSSIDIFCVECIICVWCIRRRRLLRVVCAHHKQTPLFFQQQLTLRLAWPLEPRLLSEDAGLKL